MTTVRESTTHVLAPDGRTALVTVDSAPCFEGDGRSFIYALAVDGLECEVKTVGFGVYASCFAFALRQAARALATTLPPAPRE